MLTFAIALWRFESPFLTPIPVMGVRLGVWGSIPSHSLHSQEHVMWFRVSLLARNLATPCLGREPKARVVAMRVHSLTLFALPGTCDVSPGSPSCTATLQPLALVVSLRLGLRHGHCRIGDENLSVVASLTTKTFRSLIFGHQAYGDQKLFVATCFTTTKMGLVLVTHKLASGSLRFPLT